MSGVEHDPPDARQCATGWCAAEVQAELPGLRLLVSEARHTRPQPLTGGSPPEIQERLRELSNRFRGARAVGVRREPVPAAYRVFFRQIGLDPDVVRTPIEAAVLERMLDGGFPTSGPARRRAADRAVRHGRARVGARRAARSTASSASARAARASRSGRYPEAPLLPAGRLVVADSSAALAVLFGELAPGHEPHARTHPRDAVRGTGGGGADAVRRGGAVDVLARRSNSRERVGEPRQRACTRW